MITKEILQNNLERLEIELHRLEGMRILFHQLISLIEKQEKEAAQKDEAQD